MEIPIGPPEDLDLSFPIEPMRIRDQPEIQDALGKLISGFVDSHESKLTQKQRSTLRDNYRQILLNLIRNTLNGSYTAIPQDRSKFTKGGYWANCGLSFRMSQAVLGKLWSEGFIMPPHKGFFNRNHGRGRITRIYGAAKLHEWLESSGWTKNPPDFYEEPSIEDLIELKGFGYESSSLSTSHPDVVRILAINNFLLRLNWRFKSPIRLIYSNGPLEGGRLYTRLQNVPKSTRFKTQIDGLETVELDYKSNHFMMAMTFLSKETYFETSQDPYQEIASKSGLNRDQIKKFISVSFGADSEIKAFNGLKRSKFNRNMFNNIKEVTLQWYPNMPLFKGIGVQLQSLEGQVALDILYEGSQMGIPVLPVHDSFITTVPNEEWLRERMHYWWCSHLHSKSSPKVERKDIERTET